MKTAGPERSRRFFAHRDQSPAFTDASALALPLAVTLAEGCGSFAFNDPARPPLALALALPFAEACLPLGSAAGGSAGALGMAGALGACTPEAVCCTEPVAFPAALAPPATPLAAALAAPLALPLTWPLAEDAADDAVPWTESPVLAARS